MAHRPTALRHLKPLLRPPPRHTSTSTSTSTSSVNPTEVSHFNALASTWWDPHGPARLLHLMNPLRHTFIASCLATHPPPASKLRYLDVGCGGGIFAESAARLPATAAVTGIDPSADVLRVAEAHARQDPLLHATGRLRYLHTAVEALPVPAAAEDRFDVLSLFEVVEHITRPAPFLRSCLPFVRPGGWLVLSTMARTWTSWLTTKVVAEDLVGIVPRGTHDWEKYINPEEMRAFFMAQKGWGGDGGVRVMGCVYMPGFGWRMVEGSEAWGNYFFAVRKDVDTSASTAS